MRAVLFDTPGSPSVLYVGEAATPIVGENEVLIRVAATAINRADTLQRKGLYPVPQGTSSILGLEAAGEVVGVGGAVTQWKAGDRVMALLGGGGNAEYVVADAGHVLPVPASLDMTKAAAVPEVWLTAFQLLHLVAGGVQPGQSVLVHAGGSGVGTAAVQLVKLAGGRSMVTAGSQQKIDTALSLGAERGVNYKTEDFAAAVAEWTGGKGVDIILDCVGGSYAMKNVASLAVDGRWVLYGLMGGAEVDGPVLGGLLRKRGSLLATTLRSRSREYKAELVKRFREECLEGFEGKAPLLKPIVDSVMEVSEIAAAHQKMEENKNNGKIVLTF
eukprot:TRINITY_DN8644_c0_g1_i1.p1 TRINITY_DN8644_c0_g1~~TRINITY_DN8644_c0_g1_i1.p1  ORF type:complete len:330 (-),score=102.51 TRINITY_DN8644_c0_g1_i1:51-1040(-)